MESQKTNYPKINERDDGFTVIEMVITVGIIAVLSVLGLLFYNGMNDRTKTATVENAVDQVYNLAYAYAIDGDPNTNPVEVAEEYNNSQGNKKSIVVQVQHPYQGRSDRIKVYGFMEEHESTRMTPSINSSIGEDEEPTITIPDTDTYTNFTYKCDENSSGYLPIINIGEGTKVYMWETGKKNETFKEVKYRGFSNILLGKDGIDHTDDDLIRKEAREEIARTRILSEGSGSREERLSKMYSLVGGWNKSHHTPAQREYYSSKNIIDNFSEQVQMRKDVEYNIMYDGDVETFTAPGQTNNVLQNQGIADCLRSVDNLGNSSNLKNIVYIGGINLVEVPESIPSTVMSIRGMFESATSFNDPNIKTWDVSNVYSIRSLFLNATSFNQDISDWDVSNVIVAQYTFQSTNFNHNLNKWGDKTGNIEHMDQIFEKSSFNNGCPEGEFEFINTHGETVDCSFNWRTDNLIGASRMFQENHSFNQNISTRTDEKTGITYWNMSKVETLDRTFQVAINFNNGDIAGVSSKPLNWDLRNNNNYHRLFDRAQSFSQDTTTLHIDKAIQKDYVYVNSGVSESH